ncbi:3-oxoadipate enol-lactonase [Ilumatobacter fluminis]|uniref:3-oxoadipate enol-lactonase n=1 Tax=Ilumatobacter fluminis TaxID=467091 RepID=A0A4R7HXY9_9ACTN|nr:alpha/beta hydrolase [Ilumatobacter fluminis]TDT14993.1 3-oxoadipate enol-lactonase [Ilumatobacter fluminis]
MTERFGVTVEPGVEIHVAIDGPSDGEPVVLLHGFLGSGEQWNANVEALVDAGFRVVRPDHRGHGRSTNTGDEASYTFEHLYRDALAVIDGLIDETVHLVGHSMGGLVAELIATRDPERLRSVVFVDCSPLPGRGDSIRADRVRRFLGYRLGVARLIRWTSPVLRHVKTGSAPDRTTVDRKEGLAGLERSVSSMDPAAFVAFGAHLNEHDDLRPAVRTVELPTTIMVGEFEIARLREGAEALRDAIPHATFVEIEGAGHSPNIEQPTRFDEALLTHLSREPGRVS